MKKINLLGVLITALSVFSVVSCDDGGSKEIVISGPGEQQEFMMKWAQKYLDDNKHTEYTLKWATHGEDKIDEEVTDWTNAGSPDIYTFSSDKTINLTKNAALAEVPADNLSTMNEKISSAGIESATFNGTTYSYPFTSSNGYYVYYDSSLDGIEEVIATNDFDKWVKYCEDKNYKFAYPMKTAFYSAAALNTFGAGWKVTFARDGSVESIEADYNTDKGLKAGKFIYKLVHSKAYTETQSAPGADDVAICVNGPWALTGDGATSYGAAKVKMTTLPNVTVDGETKHIKSFVGNKMYGVNPQKSTGSDKRLELLHDISLYLVSDDVQLERFRDSQTAPTSKAVSAMSEVQANASIATLAKQSVDGVAQANLPTKVWSAAEPLVTAFIAGTLDEAGIKDQLEIYNNTMKQVK